ncbi:MAG TPA: hypothetical protein VEZ42_19505 [Pseudonocardia sp.]|nr:hypothetical protein [Pseudonocardia sp.]
MTGPPPPAATEGGMLGLLLLNALLLGAFGLVFTPLYVGTVPVPLGPLLVILILPWLVLRAADIDPRPGVAAAPMWMWLLTVLVLGLWGPGGDAMLPLAPATLWMSMLLLGGGLIAGTVALRLRAVRRSARFAGPSDQGGTR